MNKDDKKQLQKLTEDDFRINIVIPLMRWLGSFDVIDYHGSGENGKDVIYKINHIFGYEIYGAIAIKNVKMTKSVIQVVASQLNDATLDFIHPEDYRVTTKIHELALITSFPLTTEAQNVINKQCGRFFPNIHVISENKLEKMIKRVLEQYYEITNNPNDLKFNKDSFKIICEQLNSKKITDNVAGRRMNVAKEGGIIDT